MSEEVTQSDRAITAVTEDGAFRVIVLRTTQTVREALEAQGVTGANAANLSDVLTGTILVRLTMAPTYRVQGLVRGAGHRGTLVADSHPDGTARALVQRPDGLDVVSLAPGAILQMMRNFPNGATHQGVVEVPETGVAGALMDYFQSSEQIVSVASVLHETDGDTVGIAGAYIVQLLPEASRAPLAVMTERLAADFSTVEQVLPLIASNPAGLLSEILYGMPHAITQTTELRFGCRCSAVRLLSSLSTLPKDEIRELMESDEQLHITCDYCRREYQLAPSALAGLLSPS